jgi:hypothetical protein
LLNFSFRDYLKSALDSEERISWGYCLSFWKNKLDWKQKNKQKPQQNASTILLNYLQPLEVVNSGLHNHYLTPAMQLLLGRYLHWAHGNTLGAGPAYRDGQLMNPIFKIYLKGDGRIAAVRYHNLFIFLTK